MGLYVPLLLLPPKQPQNRTNVFLPPGLGFADHEYLTEGAIQPLTMKNADNFAWMYTYNYLSARFGWAAFDDGRWSYDGLPQYLKNKEREAGFPAEYKRAVAARSRAARVWRALKAGVRG
jgi:hypothetical protein